METFKRVRELKRIIAMYNIISFEKIKKILKKTIRIQYLPR